GQTRQLVAGEAAAAVATNWRQVAGPAEALSTDYPHYPGVYAAGDRLFAVNRAAAEDQAAVLADDRVNELFKGLDFTRVDDRAGSFAGLIEEIWRPFLVAMLVALLVEAALCMPRRADPGRAGLRRGTRLRVAPVDGQMSTTIESSRGRPASGYPDATPLAGAWTEHSP